MSKFPLVSMSIRCHCGWLKGWFNPNTGKTVCSHCFREQVEEDGA